MLSKENSELEQDIIDMENEIKRIQQERLSQSQHYQAEIQKKEVCIRCKLLQYLTISALQSVNETIKFEVNEMRSRLRIEEFEKRIETYLSRNQAQFEEKSRIMDDL